MRYEINYETKDDKKVAKSSDDALDVLVSTEGVINKVTIKAKEDLTLVALKLELDYEFKKDERRRPTQTCDHHRLRETLSRYPRVW